MTLQSIQTNNFTEGYSYVPYDHNGEVCPGSRLYRKENGEYVEFGLVPETIGEVVGKIFLRPLIDTTSKITGHLWNMAPSIHFPVASAKLIENSCDPGVEDPCEQNDPCTMTTNEPRNKGESPSSDEISNKLAAALSDKDAVVRKREVESLAKISETQTLSDEILDKLVDIARSDEEHFTQDSAVKALGTISKTQTLSNEILDKLVDIARSDKDTVTRKHVVKSLAEISKNQSLSDEILNKLVDIALSDEDSVVRKRVVESLAEISETQTLSDEILNKLVDIALSDKSDSVKPLANDLLLSYGLLSQISKNQQPNTVLK